MPIDQALVLAGHGSHHDHRSAVPVYSHADRVRERGCFDAVRTAFWKEQPSLAEVRSTVEAASVYVVPLLTSEGYFAERVFPRELGLTGDDSASGRGVHYTEPVGSHERLTDVVVDRVHAATTEAVDDADIGVVLVGHGTDRHDQSADATVAHTDRLRDRDIFAAVETTFLDQSPNVDGAIDRVDATDLVVVPLFISNGHHVTRDIPAALGLPTDGEPFGGPTRVDGKRLWYTGAVGTAPSLTDIVLERAAEAGADTRPGRTTPETVPSDAEAAFLRWLEGGSQIDTDSNKRTRVLGELAISVSGEDDDRQYAVRHEADRSDHVGSLDQLSTPAEVRARTGLDTAGNHRPLRTARTLPSGWQFDTHEPPNLVRAVRAVYPASIDHWHHDRTGTFSTTDFDAVLDRQIGRYRELDELDEATQAGTVAACCEDCVRHRDWQAGAVDREPTDGPFPCPEPCSFLLEAARSFGELDPAAPVGAPDSTVPAAAFDQPGNRYRVRFQRAVDVGPRSPHGHLTNQ